ncbi:Gfo/Idh/MocA family oxidoreductase [Marinihelvus fidelis]|uniref:Gfo/Idh/MocA family oxidoreductase n=1 Tax=Marinihelvus fidelis TaxID=2613842 RepID=A0A5N0TF60_9GAMM|nr:Gfo/Idh/MocA family oxidoreductase [Marinihelvus fidelis]KAA9132757.1 Gfo/Idh/MocA family oxidoreductase [Marinihelvus fidelis]
MSDPTRKVRWGVLSTARIGIEKVIPALQASRYGDVRAIASRNPDSARAAASALGIATAHGSYEALLVDRDIDAIYIPLPNHMHVPWTVRAIEAGKHVLCEKPIALDANQARALVDATRSRPDLKVMEAFMYRFHPQWQAAKARVADGGLGELRAIQSWFSYFNDDPDNIRNHAAIGGGALMDIGCYNVSLSRFLFGAEPLRVMATMDRDPRFGVDRLTAGVLQFEAGTSAFTCSTQAAPYQRMLAVGTTGRLEIEIPFNAPPDRACTAWLHDGSGAETLTFDACDQYTLQGDAFARAVLDDTLAPTPLDDAVANMAVIDALVHSAESGRWESPTAS